ncbi:MAG: hypothetical protein ABIK07_19295 [Planctomycetota bacterium]|jgi:hypothetical protein|uniref:hypothetical protein n=1 Tax=uncultured Gimesia sp. TaxID=1678688 RepID=UPI002625CEA7|nr:hypothetical protein [uncultured Gimesia sp.]
MGVSSSPAINFCLLAVCLIVSQSCSEERPFVPQPSAEYVVMVNAQGEPENILIEQFFKKQDHADGVKVLVVEKKSKTQTLITPAELLKQNPNAGPYIIFKHDDPERSFDDIPR